MVKLALWLRLRAALTIVIIYNVKTIAKQKYNVRTIIHVLTQFSLHSVYKNMVNKITSIV